MSEWIALRIIDAAQENGTESGRTKYKAYFVSTKKMNRYKSNVDNILIVEGYGDCIVNEEE